MTQHTILLIQRTKDKGSRTFSDHETVAQAIEDVIAMYEKRLKEINPNVPDITYNINDLNNYIDHLADLSALVYSSVQKAYVPHDKHWIKTKVFNHLQKVAAKSAG